VLKPCNPKRSLLFKELAILAVPRSPCLQTPLLVAVKASSMSPAVPGRRFDAAAVPGPRRVAIISGPTGGPPMSPLRCPAKAKAPRSLIAVSIRLVKRYARARRRTRATVQKPFQRRGEVSWSGSAWHRWWRFGCTALCSAGKLLTGNVGPLCEQQPLAKALHAPCGSIPQYQYKILVHLYLISN
jgi:hypothetical protein